jgi:SNF2-related domain
MLQRESLGQPGEEWKVAWTVLDPSTRDVISLYQLDEKEVPRVRNEILLYCPFNGWIAGSLEEARNMTLNGRTIPIRGGCLSESMGLGKTVELLACILAHPMPNPTTDRNTKPSCQRRLVFEEQCLRGGNDDRNGDDTVGVVVDAANFADDEASGDEDDTEGMHHEPSQHGFSEEAPARTNVVTPDKNRFPVEVRWIDDMEVGSCICGEIISFPSGPRKQKNVIVFCKGCDEPMHLQCTCLESHDVAVSKKLILRRTSGNKQLECVLCEDCPCCIVANQKGTIKSRATVIVCPPAILDQWDREVKRHTRVRGGSSLKVAVYEGVESISKNQKRHASALRLLHPRFLANSDIILIPFGALMSDLGHSDDNRYIRQGDGDRWTSCSLRKRKKYRIVPSPLLSIHFWRVAIDEAQRVEVTTTKAAKMALKLNADHLWAVSGTPVGHGKLEDLYGLLLFLGLSPFDCKDWFKSCLSPAVDGVDERIKALLKDCFWRSTKASPVVKEQLGIPEMKENRIVLKFSSIEKHFYSTQLSATMRLAGDISSRTDFGSKWQLESLTESLQRLRAACCHPQVGSHGVTGGRLQKVRQLDGNSVATRVLSMEQILDKFIDDAKQKCEEAQRIAIMHTNAMAAITRLKVDAKTRGIRVEEDDRSLLMKSGDLYKESLALAETNSFPQNACGEAILTGNIGFCNPNHVMNDGNCKFSWKIQKEDCDELWAKVEYQGPPKKIKKVQFKAHLSLPEKLALENSNDFTWQVSCPARIVLQVAMASDGGEFVDVAEAPVRSDGSWSVLEKFGPTNRSRAWRILLKMKHDDGHKLSSGSGIGLFVGLDVELYEAHIDSDSLQLLHSLHNASLVYESALQVREGKNHMADEAMMQHQIASMREEAGQIELLYKRQPQILHKTCMEKFKELMRKRKAKEEELFCITTSGKASESLIDGWDDGWYHDFLSAVSLYGSESLQTAVLERIIQDIEGIYIEDNSMRFPDFSNLTGLRAALGVRLSKIRSEGLGKKQATLPATTAENEFVQIRSARYKCGAGEHARCMEAIELLSPDPDVAELVENSHCRLCKADW